MSDRTLDTLRAIAWEHAKGELRAMLATYYDDEDQYYALKEAIEEFVKRLEEEVGI